MSWRRRPSRQLRRTLLHVPHPQQRLLIKDARTPPTLLDIAFQNYRLSYLRHQTNPNSHVCPEMLQHILDGNSLVARAAVINLNETSLLTSDDIAYSRRQAKTIRYLLRRFDQKRWGLPILRCSYVSQERWEEFLCHITAHIYECVKYEEDDVLTEQLCWPIIEDEAKLNNASWQQARNVFEEWVVEDLKNNPLDPWHQSLWSHLLVDEDVNRSPYWMFFIFADEASISSVLDTQTPPGIPRYLSRGDYYFHLVVGFRKDSRTEDRVDDGNYDYDHFPPLHRKIKLMSLLWAYSGLTLRGDVNYFNYDRWHAEEDGIVRFMRAE